MQASDRLGGHIVQGHVDGVGEVLSVEEDGFARRVRVALGPDLLRYTVDKGSITLSGVSLTIAELGEDWVEVSLIPETLERTNLGDGRAGKQAERRVRHRGEVRGAVAGTIRWKGASVSQNDRDRETKASVTEAGESPFSTIEEAIEEIRRGRMVVVCDGEDRENEGDLVMAAQFATPEAVNFMAKEARGLICLALTAERCERLGLKLMAAKNEAPLQTAFTVTIEAAGRRQHRHLRPRPRPHDPGRDRPRVGPARHRRPRPHVPAAGQRRRRAGAHRPHRGQRRPRPPRRPHPGRRDLRGDERRRHHGPRPGPDPVLPAARPEDDHRRRADRLPPPHREAGRAGRRHRPADLLRRLHRGRLPLAGRRQTPRGDGQGRGRRAPRTCSSASTASASPATSSTACAATAASSWPRRWR